MRIDNKKTVEVNTSTLDHITIDVLDGSGSMEFNGKMNLGIKGIKEAYKSVVGEYSLIVFDNSNNIKTFITPDDFRYSFGGWTALTDAIIKAFKLTVGKKALINVYTDGQENDSKNKPAVAAKLINDNKDRVTVTFIGTESDVKTAQSLYQIDESNTLVYNNTGEGLLAALNKTEESRGIYYKDLSAGKDVSKGFYKTINDKTND
jgi:hypothetical protein